MSSPISTTTTPFELKLRLACGAFLWALSTALTIGLFLALAGDNMPRRIVMVALALGLEGAKVLTFRMGKGYRVISVSLIAISVLASFGSALIVIETNEATSHQASTAEARISEAYQSAKIELETLDHQINVDIERLKNLPPNYISASRELSAQIEGLRDKRFEVQKALLRPETIPTSTIAPVSMFGLIAKASGIPESESLLTLAILMFLAVILEVSIIALTQPYPTSGEVGMATSHARAEQEIGDKKMSYAPIEMSHTGISDSGLGCIEPSSEMAEHKIATQIAPMGSYEASKAILTDEDREMTADRFLLAMADGMPYPTLRGRDATATALGVPLYQAKLLVSQLAREGKIKVEGKRFVQTGMSHPIPTSRVAPDIAEGVA